MMSPGSSSPSRVGVVLLDSQLRLVGSNEEAARILSHPGQLQDIPSLDAVLPAIHKQPSSPSSPALTEGFRSGRRAYICRAFLLDRPAGADDCLQPKFVVMLERVRAREGDVSLWSRQCQLTARESETVEHLAKGLSSKEIARKMNISPSTVKSFLKLVMVKVGASNRAGIVATMHEATRDPVHHNGSAR